MFVVAQDCGGTKMKELLSNEEYLLLFWCTLFAVIVITFLVLVIFAGGN